MPTPVLGIDLGTTNSVMAVVEGDDPRVLQNNNNHRITPSAVLIPPPDETRENPYVGHPAVNQAQLHPENVIESIKREMGEETCIEIAGEELTPPEVSAHILRYLKRGAAERLDVEFDALDSTVITVPAYFTEDQRQKTRAAAEMAEFSSIQIINEPSAAALAYGYNDTSEREHSILVYDLGGGTFDVSLLEVGDGIFTVQATAGDDELGGDDWDASLVDWVDEQIQDEHGVSPLDTLPGDSSEVDVIKRRRRLFDEARTVKEQLCNQGRGSNVVFSAQHIVDNDNHHISFTDTLDLQTFQSLTSDLIERTIPLVRDVLGEPGYNPSQVDDIVLVGGATNMPQVKTMLSNEFGLEPSQSINPDEAVAKGAALHGRGDILLQEVTPLSLGIKLEGGVFAPLIERNSPLPAEGSEVFTTSRDNQTAVEIDVYQGERKLAEENRKLRRFYLTDIPPAPRGMPQIEVSFEVDRDGLITATAKRLGNQAPESRCRESVSIDGALEMSDAEVQQFVDEARAREESDQQRLKAIETANEAEAQLDKARRYIESYPHLLEDEEVEQIQQQMDEIELLLSDDNTPVESLASSVEDLEQMVQTIGQRLIQLEAQGETPVDRSAESPFSGRYAGSMRHTPAAAETTRDSDTQPGHESSHSSPQTEDESHSYFEPEYEQTAEQESRAPDSDKVESMQPEENTNVSTPDDDSDNPSMPNKFRDTGDTDMSTTSESGNGPEANETEFSIDDRDSFHSDDGLFDGLNLEDNSERPDPEDDSTETEEQPTSSDEDVESLGIEDLANEQSTEPSSENGVARSDVEIERTDSDDGRANDSTDSDGSSLATMLDGDFMNDHPSNSERSESEDADPER